MSFCVGFPLAYKTLPSPDHIAEIFQAGRFLETHSESESRS